VKDTSAKYAAQALLQHMGRYGASSQIRSDRGSQFVNETIKELLHLVGTEHCMTTAYSKEENAIVERANKEVMRHLRAIVFHKKIVSDWSVNDIPMVQRILNSEVKESLGVSPAQLLFGNAIALDRGILLPHAAVTSDSLRLSIKAARMLNRQALFLKIARETQQAHDDYHISQANPNRTEYPINSYVLQSYNVKPSGKFHTHWEGPKRVININKSIYTVQDLITNKLTDTHIKNLKPFIYDPEFTNPTDVARQDQQEFLIDHIIAHNGDRRSKTEMEFLVRWAGHDESEDSWEPWTALRDTTQLLDYLKNNKMSSLLSKRRRTELEQDA
jgi:hypothetical protein